MTAFDQGGADFVGKTKKALREACRDNPDAVFLYSTSAFGGGYSGSAGRLPEGLTFNVVGPDPYTKRTWYASVTRSGGGVTVK